jgi:hypothetical protein
MNWLSLGYARDRGKGEDEQNTKGQPSTPTLPFLKRKQISSVISICRFKRATK